MSTKPTCANCARLRKQIANLKAKLKDTTPRWATEAQKKKLRADRKRRRERAAKKKAAEAAEPIKTEETSE
jgi:hypothetical protein